MKRLILVAGPSCAGKTTLISGMLEGDMVWLRETIGISNPAEWMYLEAKQLHKFNIPSINNLVLHYDILEQHTPTGYKHIPELIVNYEDIIIITLTTSPFYLLLRNTNRLLNYIIEHFAGHIRNNRKRYSKLTRLWQKEILYLNTGSTNALCEDWLNYIDKSTINKHLLFDTSGIAFITTNHFVRIRVSPVARGIIF